MPRPHQPITARRAAPLLGCLAALLAGCGSSSSSSGTTAGAGSASAPAAGLKVATTPKYAAPAASAPVQSGVVQIAYRNIAIAPDAVRVKVGSTVRWTNYDEVQHNVTIQGGPQRFASSDFGHGASFSVKLTRPGTLNYQCTIHPASMNGTIEVVR